MRPEIAESPLLQYGIGCLFFGLFLLICGLYTTDADDTIWVGLGLIFVALFLVFVLAVRAKQRFGG